jgi:hypothetical protein
MRFSHRIRLLLSPWLLVVVGIAFNIFSAVITNYFIDINNQEIHAIDDEASSIELRINNYWQSRQDIERKREVFLLLLTQRGESKKLPKGSNQEIVYAYVRMFLTKLIEEYGLDKRLYDDDSLLSAQNVMDITEQSKQQIIDRIDDIYLDKIFLDKQKQPIASRNSTLMSLALFLQLVGLILVLARDLRRGRS